MAITVDSAGAIERKVFVASHTFSHTCSGSNRLIFVCIARGSNAQISGVTYAGVALTKGMFNSRGSVGVEGWYLTAPATGANNVVITFSQQGITSAMAVSWVGVDQTTSIGTPLETSGNSQTSLNESVSSSVDDVVMDILEADGVRTLVQGAGQTLLGMLASAPSLGVSYKDGAAGTTSLSWTWAGSSSYSYVGVAIKPFTPPPQYGENFDVDLHIKKSDASDMNVEKTRAVDLEI